MRNLTVRAIAASTLGFCAPLALASPPSVDSQIWSELDATHAFNSEFSATAIVTTRIGHDLPNPTLTAAGLQLDYRLGSWIASATSYYVSIRNAVSGAHVTVWLPAAALTYQITAGDVSLSDRNRVEQLDGIPGSPTRYRNRAAADWRFPGHHTLTDVFVADEVFYDFSRDRWTRNRAQAGLEYSLGSDTDVLIYYMRQKNTYGAPDRLNVVGITMQVDIK